MTAFTIERVEVGATRLEALVRVNERWMRTSAAGSGVVKRARELLPGLARHTCENDAGASLLVELHDTETAHLLEHVACELMALSGSPRSLRGETAWDFARDGRGVFRVGLEFDNDVVALGALKEAAVIVEWLLTAEGVRPDVAPAVRHLRAVRG